MNHNLKALGLALVAALALTAVMASAASAQFTSSSHHTILSGTQKAGTNNVFSAGSGFGAITCEGVTFSGTAAATQSESGEYTPTHSNCKDSLGRTAHSHETWVFIFITKGRTWTYVGVWFVTITNSKKETVCTVTMNSQEGVNGISYKNLGGTSGIEATTNSTNIKSTIEGGFFNCGTATTNATAGTYNGVAVITGKDTSGSAVAISEH